MLSISYFKVHILSTILANKETVETKQPSLNEVHVWRQLHLSCPLSALNIGKWVDPFKDKHQIIMKT